MVIGVTIIIIAITAMKTITTRTFHPFTADMLSVSELPLPTRTGCLRIRILVVIVFIMVVVVVMVTIMIMVKLMAI